MLRFLCVLYASTVFMSCRAQCPATQYGTVSTLNSRALALTPGKAQLTKFATRTTSTLTASAVYDATAQAVTFALGQSVPGGTHDFALRDTGFTVVLVVIFKNAGSQVLFDLGASGARIFMWKLDGTTVRFAMTSGVNWCETEIAIVYNTWLTIVGTFEHSNNRLGIKIGTEFKSSTCAAPANLQSSAVQLGGAAGGAGGFTGSMRGFYAVDSAISNDALDIIISNMNANKDTLLQCNCLFGSSTLAGSDICQCKAGYTGADGATCTLCLAGTYKNVTGAATCQACPSKSTSPIGSSNSSGCQCLEGYIDRAPGANNCQPPPPHELALCAKLADATAHVLALDADKHSVANLQEANCVRIDPCTQQTKQGVAAAAGAWHHVAALGLTSSGDGAHYNHHALEYARVPQGIVLETCPPDFAHYRATGTWRCNADPTTHVRIQGACPSLLPHTILDCLAPAQFDAGSESKQLNPV